MLHYSYDQVCKDISEIGTYLTYNRFDPELIVGLKRGGLVPAVHLSHMFDAAMEVIGWSTRDHVQREHNIAVSEAIQRGDNVLIVDDINDSGLTLSQVREHYKAADKPNVKFVVLVNKMNSSFKVDYAPFTMADDTWVQFYWEEKSLTSRYSAPESSTGGSRERGAR